LTHWASTAADHPRSAGAHARFALLLLQEAFAEGARLEDPRFMQAEQSIERAARINARLPEVWQARGVLALMRGDCATAAPALDRALALRPADREITTLRRRCP
jgi:Flp pilus assembly protein TadD